MKPKSPSANRADALLLRLAAFAAADVALAVLLSGCFITGIVHRNHGHHPLPPLPGPSCPIVPRPTVKSIRPDSGPASGGTRVTITGTCFRRGARVLFGTAAASAVTVTSTAEITVTSPPGHGTVNVIVQTSVGRSASNLHDQFRYAASSGPVGVSQGQTS